MYLFLNKRWSFCFKASYNKPCRNIKSDLENNRLLNLTYFFLYIVPTSIFMGPSSMNQCKLLECYVLCGHQQYSFISCLFDT